MEAFLVLLVNSTLGFTNPKISEYKACLTAKKKQKKKHTKALKLLGAEMVKSMNDKVLVRLYQRAERSDALQVYARCI